MAGIFDRKNRRRTPGGASGSLFGDSSDTTNEVPEVDDTLERLDMALEADIQEGGCACWG